MKLYDMGSEFISHKPPQRCVELWNEVLARLAQAELEVKRLRAALAALDELADEVRPQQQGRKR